MKRFFCFTVRLAGSVRKSVNNVLASRRLALESLEDRLALSATPIPCASPPTDNEAILCCTAQLDTDYMEAIPIAAEVLAAPPQRCCADGGAQTNENVDACNAILADWSEDEDFFIEEAPGLSAAVDSETTFGYGETDEFLACAALEEDDVEVPDDALGDGCGSGCGDGCGSGCGDGCGGDGCDAGCGNAVLSLALGAPGNMVAGCFDGTATNPELELVVIQGPYGTVTVPASMTGSNESGYGFAITISNPGTYWNKSVGSSNDTFVWRKPNNVTNAAATRDFTFNYIVYHDANNNGSYDDGETIAASESAYLHIAYAEILIKVAGEGEFVPLTAANSNVIVGQKIEARIGMDSRLSISNNPTLDGSQAWSFMSTLGGESRVKNYTPTAQSCTVEYLGESDYSSETIAFYEVEKQNMLIMCNVPLVWTPNGSNDQRSAMVHCFANINVVAPEANIFCNYLVPRSEIRPNSNGDPTIMSPGFLYGSNLRAAELTPGNYATGEVNYLITLQDNSSKRKNGIWEERDIAYINALDLRFPYGIIRELEDGGIELTQESKNLGSTPDYVDTFDQPSEGLGYKYANGYDAVQVDVNYTISLIYKPSGTDCIWVPLSRMYLRWRARAVDNQRNNNWSLEASSVTERICETVVPLQTWSINIEPNLHW